MISAVCFLVFFAVVADTVLRKRDMLSPFRIYLCFHSLTYGIACLGLHRAMTPFSGTTLVVYFGSGLAFLIGTQLPAWADGATGPRIRARGRIEPGKRNAGILDADTYDWNLHFLFAAALTAIYFLGILIAAKGIGGMPVFMDNVHDAIYDFMTYNMISGLCISACGLAMGMLFMSAVSGRHRFLGLNVSWYLLAAVAGVHSLTLSRSSFIFFIFFALVYYNYAVRRLHFVKLSVFMLLAFGAFAGIAYVKTQDMIEKYRLKESGIKTDDLAKLALAMPYLYVANNFWNLDYGIKEENHQVRHGTTYGVTTASGFLDGIYLGGFLGGELRQSYGWEDIYHKQTQKVVGLNTVGYQWGLYKDFGVAGALILPFLAGIALGLLHYRMEQVPAIPIIAAYSYMAYVIGFSWFLAFWESPVYVYPFLYLVIACWWCSANGNARQARHRELATA
jgi:oligosaccharide repeat unit polymerase